MIKVLSAIDSGCELVGKLVGWAPLLASIAIVYEIILRSVFNSPTLWVAEGTVMICGLMYVFGGAWTMKSDRHVRIDMVYGRFGERGKAVLDCLTFAFFLFYIGAMAYASAKYAIESYELKETAGTAWDPPIYPVKILFAVSFLILLLQGTADFIRNLIKAIKG